MGYTSQHIAFQLFSFHLCPCFLCNTHLIMKSYHNTCGNESCDKEKYQTYHIILIRHRKCMHRHCKKIIKQQHTAYRSHHSIQITGSCNCYDQYTHNIDHQNIFFSNSITLEKKRQKCCNRHDRNRLHHIFYSLFCHFLSPIIHHFILASRRSISFVRPTTSR